jgi:predicted nucleic acid-binding protein
VVLALARRHDLSFYEALYLELAQRQGTPPATLDTALAQAARRESVTPTGETTR